MTPQPKPRAAARIARSLAGLWLVAVLVPAADAAAAPGDLAQKAGTAGCSADTGAGGCLDGTALDSAASVTLSPDGQSAYVASFNSGAVAVFDRAADGTLTQKAGAAGCISDTGSGGACVDGTALGGAASVTVSPDGQSAYVASFSTGAVAVFDRAADGGLTQKAGTAGCVSDTGTGGLCIDGRGLGSASSVTVSPGGQTVYVASNGSDAVAVFDRAPDGGLTQKAGAAGCISEIGADGCVDGRALDGAFSVMVSPDGQSAYLASDVSDAVAVFDRAADGTLTQKAGAAGCTSELGADGCADGTALDIARSVTVSPDGQSAYVASQISGAVAVFDRTADGALAQKAGAAGCISDSGAGGCVDGRALSGAYSVTVSPDGESAYVASAVSDAVAVFGRAADGALAQKAGAAGCISDSGADGCVDGRALDGAFSVAVSPDGQGAYVASAVSDAVAVFDRELPPPPPPPPSDTTRPVMRALSLSPIRFRAAGKGPSIVALVGSRVSYRVSEPAAVRFRVERALPGRRVRGRCAKPKRSNRRAKRCTRYKALRGGFTHGGKAGQNRFTFRGRLRARKLRPGRYRLRAVATDGAGNKSRPKRSRFRIVPS